VAHEINTPVGVAVTGASTLADETTKLAGLLQSGAMKRSDLDSYVETASSVSKLLLSNMSRAANLIHSFKSVAVDQASEEKREFHLKAYLEEVLLSVSPMLRRAGHRIVLDCQYDVALDTYPGALSQIITNLVMNAVIHAFSDNEQGSISISVIERAQHMLELRFSDNGKGIPVGNLSKIFDPFFTTMRAKGGSGLGLSVVHNLVTGRLGGTILVDSLEGQGTTFVLCFPTDPART